MAIRVRVLRNNLPRIIRELPEAADRAVDETARSIERMIEANAWRDTGVVISTTVARTEGVPGHAEVWVGEVSGRGFYVKFLEFGTTKMVARPVVGPAGHMHEPVLITNMSREIGRLG